MPSRQRLAGAGPGVWRRLSVVKAQGDDDARPHASSGRPRSWPAWKLSITAPLPGLALGLDFTIFGMGLDANSACCDRC
jgi:hypothetical protein